jgi:anti-sigma-K factor RskA
LFEPMTKKLSDNDKQLASEYALGVLGRSEMAVAETRFDTEPLFRREVEDWQARLMPMLDEVAKVTPKAAVWDNIARATGFETTQASTSLWQNLSFWRGFSVLSGSLAAASIAALLFFPAGLFNPPPSAPLVAMLTSTGKAPAFMARFDSETRSLVIRAATVDSTETRVAELWLIPGDGIPRSLGILDDKGRGTLKLNDVNQAVFSAGGTLAISLEPAGGSPTGAPTGPVIATGKLASL